MSNMVSVSVQMNIVFNCAIRSYALTECLWTYASTAIATSAATSAATRSPSPSPPPPSQPEPGSPSARSPTCAARPPPRTCPATRHRPGVAGSSRAPALHSTCREQPVMNKTKHDVSPIAHTVVKINSKYEGNRNVPALTAPASSARKSTPRRTRLTNTSASRRARRR